MRADLEIILEWIPKGSRVLDLGCGSGDLLRHLNVTGHATGLGVEIEQKRIIECVKKGVAVVQKNLNTGLADFGTQSFDMVLMTQSLQQMQAPDDTLLEMLRIGREAIITFPNFGHWRTRGYLGFKGRMPMSKVLPNTWYNTPNIHLCTFKDFEQLCAQHQIRIKQRTVTDHQHRSRHIINWLPNLLGEVAIYHLERP